MGRLCFVWAILYITFFLGSRRRAVQGILFAVSVIAAVVAIYGMLSAWESVELQSILHSLQHARLGLDRDRRLPLDHRRIPRTQGPRPHRRRPRILPRAALVLSNPGPRAYTIRATALQTLDGHRSQSPCLHARRRLRCLPLLVGRALASRARSSTSASSASPHPSHGSTSVTFSTR